MRFSKLIGKRLLNLRRSPLLLLSLALFTPVLCQTPVNIYVSAVDRAGVPIKDLTADNFILKVDGKPQPLSSFSKEREPAIIALLFDVSGSMYREDGKPSLLSVCREAALEFLSKASDDDEYYLYAFDATIVEQTEAQSRSAMINAINNDHNFPGISNPSKSNSAVYDAIGSVADKIGQSRKLRKIIVVLTDGLDSSSRPTEFRSKIIENGALLYAPIALVRNAMSDAASGQFAMLDADSRLRSAVKESGGQYFESRKNEEAVEFVHRLAATIQNQYRLTFIPPPAAKAGEEHKIDVTLNLSKAQQATIVDPQLAYRTRFVQ